MLFAALFPGAPGWLIPAAVLLAATLAVLAWGYRRASHGGRVRVAAGVIKALGVAALAACLIEPLWSGTRAKPGANLFLIVADNSQGMTIRDRGADSSRAEQLRAELTNDKSAWQVRLEQDFEVRRYRFDSRLHNSADFHDLSFDGRATSLGLALSTLAERFRGRPVAGVLLFTDGIATDLPNERFDPSGLPPIFPIVCGTEGPPRDIAITSVTVTQTAFEDSPVTVRVDARAAGYARQPIVAQVLSESGEKMAEETLPAGEDGQPLTFRLHLQPRTPGISFYSIRVAARSELAPVEQSAEATLANNRRLVVVDRGTERYDVLYVAGRPNWEFKFLRRAIDADRQVRLLGMIRVAKREPKFAFRSRDRGMSNPLFSGLKEGTEADEDAARYDEPVLVRLGTLDEAELRDGFPKTRESLYAYHAVVLDDLEAQFFTHEQMALLRRFVSERGGGFLMLGGQESFRQGKYDRTPIEELLPVYLDRAPDSRPGDRMRLELTREGWLQPWVRLRDHESDEKTRLEKMPEFRAVNRVHGVKPGASVLATVTDTGGKSFPALAAQQFGRGRAGAVLVGDLWRWALRQDPEDRDLEKAWRQMIRWLVADVPERIEIRAEPTSESAELVRLVTRVRSREFEPLDNAAVVVTVRLPDGTETQLAAEPSATEAGVYEAEFASRDAGPYRAESRVTDDQGNEIGKSRTGWTADPAAIEFQSLEPNRALLREIATASGGELIDRDRLHAFVAGLPNRHAPITEQWAYPLWHRASVFLFAMTCLIGEWGLRRWRGLP